MRFQIYIIILLVGLISTSCKKKKPELGAAPTMEDAQFTFAPTAESPNIIQFTATKSGTVAVWDFGNGTSAKGRTVKATYPLKGSYLVKITVFSRGGSVTLNKEISIAEDDLTLLNSPDIVNLTGGVDGQGYKTWVIDSTRVGHFGVGPNPASAAGFVPEWYSAEPLQQGAMDLYNDRYTFYLEGFQFDMKTQGRVFVDHRAIGEFSSTSPTSGEDFTAVLDDQLDENWNLIDEEGTKYLSTTGKSFIGFYAGTRKYQILKLGENELSLRYVDANASSPALAWYLRLVPLGYKGIDNPVDTVDKEPELTKYSLPIDFEIEKVNFEVIEEQTDTIVANPDTAGNSSAWVLETEKGTADWSGVFIDLKDKLDFSIKKTISLKVYSPIAEDFLIKIEDSKSNNSIFVEKFIAVTTTNKWVEITADFSGTAAGTYDRLVLIPGWKKPSSGKYYLDDIEQK